MKEFARQFYNSKAWKECKNGYIKSVNGLCERCLKKGKVKPGKIVHHKVTLTPENINDPNITLNWDLLEYDCQDCHNQEHHGNDFESTREDVTFDINGDLIKKE